MKKVKVIQDKESELPIEVLAKSIEAISRGIQRLRAGRLNEKALLLLIQHASPSPYRSGQRVCISEIKAVLDGMQSLEKTYLKKPAQQGGEVARE